MSSKASHDAMSEMMKEDADFKREQERRFKERVVRTAKLNPDLTLTLLSERFGVSDDRIKYILREAGVQPPGAERLYELGRQLCGTERPTRGNLVSGFFPNQPKRAVGLERDPGAALSVWRGKPAEWTCRGGGLELKLMASTLDEAVSAFRKYAEERGVVLRECTARKLKRRAVPFRFPEVKP